MLTGDSGESECEAEGRLKHVNLPVPSLVDSAELRDEKESKTAGRFRSDTT